MNTKLSEVERRVHSLEMYVGTEEKMTGLHGAINRLFAEQKEIRALIHKLGDGINELAQAMRAREDQAKGAIWSARIFWLMFCALLGSGLIVITKGRP